MRVLLENPVLLSLQPLFRAGALSLATVLVGLIVHYFVFRMLVRLAHHTETEFDDSLLKHGRGPSRLLFPLILLNFVVPLLRLTSAHEQLVRHALSLGFIAAMGWLLIRATAVVSDVLQRRYDISAEDNLMSRKIHTQLRVFRRAVSVVIIVLAGASMLMTFDTVRQLGTSILASAGIMGIVVGMAAQRTLSNLIAGVQIAITQPIRIDDVVIVEGEWGRIEEITFTYVVVRIWDLRRLVVPISYFIEKPFQNWTRVTADVLGTVFLHVDYSVPLNELRKELHRLVEGSDLWDGKVCGLQVTDASEKTLEARALMSTADASKGWDLRCQVREGLLAFIQQNYPEALPRVRAELESPPPTRA